jgi:tyrosyl-tRNA synthetase
MGKTHKGAVWLDPELTSPYDYYQYWMNQDDQDTPRFLALFTFLPMEEIERLGALEGADIRKAKEILAYEATKLCHGPEEAEKARLASRQLFQKDASGLSGSVPTQAIARDELAQGIPAYILFERVGLSKTRSEARRLIAQGGGYVNQKRITAFDQVIALEDLDNDSILLRGGKKRYLRVTPQ